MRKIYFLTIVFISLSFLSNAQIRKGSVFLGGDIGYSSQNEEQISPTPGSTNLKGEYKFTHISPSVGIVVKENVIAGIDFTYGKSDSKFLSSTTNSKIKALGGGIFVRRYFPLANRFYFFGQVRLGYQDRDEEYTSLINSDRNHEDSWSIQAGLFPGLSYNVYKSLYLEMGLNNLLQIQYQSTERTQTSGFGGTTSLERKSFSIGSSLSNSPLNIGVRFILPKK